MRFQDAVATCFRNYANFSGRARRSEYWFFVLFATAATLLLSVIDGAVSPGGIGVLSTLFSIATFLPALSAGVRRLHDLDRSGWWMLIGFVPLLGAILLLVWFCGAGTAGPNRYGPDPVADRFGAVPA